jgi:hypothetical protein
MRPNQAKKQNNSFSEDDELDQMLPSKVDK